ncbi:group 1 truncated hemoglobin [Actimicrobium antarcticum]|uniref:Group 1 truncated hemoglobin n=1 Tax=Actimicrobium antarcticum TaxID=1051899 RepID=A0ABP7TZY5_9BURK
MNWFVSRLATLLLLSSLTMGAPAWAADELFQGLGRQSGIDRLVDTLVPLLLADVRLGNSLQDPNIDMVHFKQKLAEQFCDLSGGACKYSGKDMATIHDGLDITAAQFYALVEDLQLAMDREGVTPAMQNRLLARLAPMFRDVVTR